MAVTINQSSEIIHTISTHGPGGSVLAQLLKACLGTDLRPEQLAELFIVVYDGLSYGS